MYNRQRKRRGRRPSRLDRIERKCDRILSELLILRQRFMHRPDELDAVIERMHKAARKLKEQSRRERDAALRMFHSKTTE
jgi:hypothetical protein